MTSDKVMLFLILDLKLSLKIDLSEVYLLQITVEKSES